MKHFTLSLMAVLALASCIDNTSSNVDDVAAEDIATDSANICTDSALSSTDSVGMCIDPRSPDAPADTLFVDSL